MIEYLVTGGAGFIGSHLVRRLVADKHRVRVLDNFATGKRENLADLEGRYELVEGDMAEPAIAARACDGVRVVLHEAAIPSVPKAVADPATSHRANIEGTFNLLLAAKNARVHRFIYAASSSAYGESPTLPKVETMPSSPLSPYAVQKLTGEMYCKAFARCYGMQTLSMRYFNVFGPRQDPKSQYAAAIPAFVTAILQDRQPLVYGDGNATRDFTYIDNIVEANLLAASVRETAGQTINVACGEQISINGIIQEINIGPRQEDHPQIHGTARRRHRTLLGGYPPRRRADRLQTKDTLCGGIAPRHRLVRRQHSRLISLH